MTSVRKRFWESTDGVLKSCWVVDWADQSNKRHLKSFLTEEAARAWILLSHLEIRSRKKADNHFPSRIDITVAEAAVGWLTNCEVRGVEPFFLRDYRINVNRYILPYLGHEKLIYLTSPGILTFCDELILRESNRTVSMVLRLLISILDNTHDESFLTIMGIKRNLQGELRHILIGAEPELETTGTVESELEIVELETEVASKQMLLPLKRVIHRAKLANRDVVKWRERQNEIRWLERQNQKRATLD